MTTTPPAVLVIGHGSRDVEGIEEFKRLATHLRARFPERLCETGFLEFATPLISDGVERLLEQGAERITAIPGMLFAAGHAKNDIPSEINALQAAHPGLSITYGTELGVHARMLAAARARIEEAEAAHGPGPGRENTLLLFVGRGASDPDANSNGAKIARMLWEGMGFGWCELAYSGVTRPLVPETLEHAARLGYARVIVFPYFLFTGRLVKRIYRWADAFAADHPAVEIVKAPYLNDHAAVLEAFVDRLHETERGAGNMNCQMCQYRESIVGFEANVGAPQVGHHHHVRGAGTDTGHDHGHHHHHHAHHAGHGRGHAHDHEHDERP